MDILKELAPYVLPAILALALWGIRSYVKGIEDRMTAIELRMKDAVEHTDRVMDDLREEMARIGDTLNSVSVKVAAIRGMLDVMRNGRGREES